MPLKLIYVVSYLAHKYLFLSLQLRDHHCNERDNEWVSEERMSEWKERMSEWVKKQEEEWEPITTLQYMITHTFESLHHDNQILFLLVATIRNNKHAGEEETRRMRTKKTTLQHYNIWSHLPLSLSTTTIRSSFSSSNVDMRFWWYTLSVVGER